MYKISTTFFKQKGLYVQKAIPPNLHILPKESHFLFPTHALRKLTTSGRSALSLWWQKVKWYLNYLEVEYAVASQECYLHSHTLSFPVECLLRLSFIFFKFPHCIPSGPCGFYCLGFSRPKQLQEKKKKKLDGPEKCICAERGWQSSKQ